MRSSALSGHNKRHKVVIAFCFLLCTHVVPVSLALGLESDVQGREGHAASNRTGGSFTDKAAASTVETRKQVEAVQHQVQLTRANREDESAEAFGQTSSCGAVQDHVTTAEQKCPASPFSAFFLHLIAANTSQPGAHTSEGTLHNSSGTASQRRSGYTEPPCQSN